MNRYQMVKNKKNIVVSKVHAGKIPTILGLFFLLVTLLLLHYISQSRIFRSGAADQSIPKNGKVTNVIDHSFSVSWQTDAQASGFLEVFVDGEKLVYFDSRDQSFSSLGNYELHYVYVDGIKPDTEYQFQIVSNGKSYSLTGQQNEKSTVKTAAIYSGKPPEAKLAFGRVYRADGQVAAGVLVYLNIPGVASLSSMTSSSGTWVVPLSFAYNASLSAPAVYNEAEVKEEIVVEGGSLGRSEVINFTKDNRPVRNIILGKNSDFTTQQVGANDELGSTANSGSSSFVTDNSVTGKSKEFKITSPSDGETITTARPEIFGTGPQSGLVKITIESLTTYESSLEIDETERWAWTPPADLEPGDHTLTVEYTTPQGEKKSFIRNFIVLAAEDENNPAFTATPSGQTATSTPVPSVVPTNTPTLSPTPTTDLSRSTMPATESGVPKTGFLLPVILTFLIGVSLLSVGVFRLF
jgi:hypothetical protein